ncbi:DUF6497 family protein [Cognatishimia activa]|uniref:Acetolactate synthase n=1 Tax=Cognatishimia activa TaxID=1715691 RepID=A0A0P1ITM5_9RHOB|nr:DUF6497 family protein [Cognatishimia activa]MEE2945657.1 DUF6497 family protein [Pseudomonadota bacterium]CUI78393.1 hypothetical protein TA5113_01456 [Cognatishimia activa]CUK26809.1 hypothetical protein TA5114_02627 [Cognatishimia activa]
MLKRTKFVAFGGVLVLATTAGAMEVSPAVPSGLKFSLQEAFMDALQDGTQALRLRYVAPEIGTSPYDYTGVADDFMSLCTDIGLPMLAESGQSADQVIVSFSNQETEFGVANPNATQYFEVFTLENDTCIWEAF